MFTRRKAAVCVRLLGEKEVFTRHPLLGPHIFRREYPVAATDIPFSFNYYLCASWSRIPLPSHKITIFTPRPPPCLLFITPPPSFSLFLSLPLPVPLPRLPPSSPPCKAPLYPLLHYPSVLFPPTLIHLPRPPSCFLLHYHAIPASPVLPLPSSLHLSSPPPSPPFPLPVSEYGKL